MASPQLDYHTPPRAPVGTMEPWSVTTWLIIINVAVFIIDRLLPVGTVTFPSGESEQFRTLEWWGHFSVTMAIKHYQVWRFLSFQFLHADLNHIVFNMLSLFFFGPLIEGYLGRRRFLAFYLICGIAGPIAYVIMWGLGVWGAAVPGWVPLIGASAGIFGVLIAAAAVAPNATVLVMGAIPAKLKTVAWCLIALALYTVFSHGHNAGGEAAHLGGAVVGYFLIRKPQLLNVFEYGYKSGRPKLRY